jgi:hypothetical protein
MTESGPNFWLVGISIVVGIAVALITLNWFFTDGDDSTRSMQEYDPSMPWWSSKFGIWLTVSIVSAIVTYLLLPTLWSKLVSLL